MAEPVCRFLELLRTSDNQRLANAFRTITPSEELCFEAIDGLYAAARGERSDTDQLVSRLRPYVPNLPEDKGADAVGFYAEGVLEARIAQRNGVTQEFQEFLKEFGQR